MILVSLGVFCYVRGEIKALSKEIDIFALKQQYYNQKIFKDKVIIELPRSGQVIVNPVRISGNVSGNWFFEGQIMSKIIDADGTLLGQGPLVGTDNWMTGVDVQFEGIIPFAPPYGVNGFIVIEADNPIGEENPPLFEIPVLFTDTFDTVCVGGSCGECIIGAVGTNGFCVHNSATKNL